MNLVKEEALPADAPPIPEGKQPEDTAWDLDAGEILIAAASIEFNFFHGQNFLI